MKSDERCDDRWNMNLRLGALLDFAWIGFELNCTWYDMILFWFDVDWIWFDWIRVWFDLIKNPMILQADESPMLMLMLLCPK